MANKIDLASYVARIEADMSGLSSGLNQADGLIKGGIGGMVNWSKVAITGLVAGVVAGIGVTIKKGVDSFIEFEGKMNEVYTLLPDITETAMSKMEEQVKNLSKEVGKLPDEVIPALYQSLSAGVSQDNVFDFLEVASKGAIAGVTDTEIMVDGLTSVLNAYQMEASEAGKISDIMFQTIKFGKTTADELASSLFNVIPTASSLGVSFEEIGAGLATITAQGTPTSVATTQMRQMFVELSKESAKTSQIFKELSGQSFNDFIANGGNVQDALQMLEVYAKDNNIAISDLFGSVEAGNAALQLTGGSTELFSKNLNEMANSADATEMAYNTMDKGIGRSIEKIKVGMSGMILDLGEKLAPAIAKTTDFILAAMPTISTIVETTFNVIGGVIQNFVGVIDWLVVNISQFVSDNEVLFTSVGETIKTVFDTIAVTVNLFIDAFKVYWNAYGEYIMNYIKIVWDTVSGVFKGALDTINGILNLFISLFKGDWEGMGIAIQQITEGFWNIIRSLFSGAIEYITNIMNAAIATLTGIATSIMEGVKTAFSKVWESIKIWFSESFGALFIWFGELGETFFNIGSDILSNVWSGLKSVWSDLSDWVSDKVDWIMDKLDIWNDAEDEMSKSKSSSNQTSGGTYILPSKPLSFDVGTPFVPSDQLAFIHKGEMITPAKYNPNNPANQSKSTQPTSSTTENHFHISKVDFPNVKDAKEIENAIKNLPNRIKQRTRIIGVD